MGFAAAAVGAVLQSERAAVRFGNLAAEDEANPGASGLGGEKRDKKIRGIRNAKAFIQNQEIQIGRIAGPFDVHAAVLLAGGIGGVANQIDEQLLELVAIHLDGDARPVREVHGDAALESGNAADELGKIHGRESRLREASQLRVGGHEAPQGFGPRANDAQSLADVAKDGAIGGVEALKKTVTERERRLRVIGCRKNRRAANVAQGNGEVQVGRNRS